MSSSDFDLCVIGGGINGTGIARDAAGRGLSVLLVEAGDLASATSSASTKLVHGGLRYLEYLDFRLVRESLREREILLAAAPHLVRPLDFVLPHDESLRPAWMLRAGLFLYDHLAGRKRLKKSRALDLRKDLPDNPLKEAYDRGFLYADCRVDDARLVILNALDAAEKGAQIVTRTACTKLENAADFWRVHLMDTAAHKNRIVKAAMVVNAAGPWVRGLLEHSGLAAADMQVPGLRLLRGSHIIVPRKFAGERAFMLQQKDRRIIFAIPYERDYTLVGTTEVPFSGDPAAAAITDGEAEYLCGGYNQYFAEHLDPAEIVWSWSGVRPLFDDGKGNATAATRDYRFHMHREFKAPLLSVFGGKLTTYRRLAEEAVNRLMRCQGRSAMAWTAAATLPGGDIGSAGMEDFIARQEKRYGWLPPDVLRRYAYSYGSRMDVFLGGARALRDLGRHYGDHVYEAEIVYLVRAEWARNIEDIVWRRSKLGLHAARETLWRLESALPEIVREHAVL